MTPLPETATANTAANPLEAFAQELTPKVAVSYLRVSTTGQARRGGGDDEGFSIPAQRDANRRKAATMGAIVVKEFVDRGASARSANRPELQRMLEYLADHDVDYVIVHKLDRLARSRADDVEISKALESAHVRLVSTTEAIDATPSGMLLHGIMSSIAEFYSRNLAAEVTKGLSQKAQGGGTVGRAPLGYRNIRKIDAEGRELRTVVTDPDRAALVRKAFELYATGDWTVRALTDHVQNLGLTTVPTPKMTSRPVREGHLHKILVNPYYTGVTTYKGVQYEGRHEALVDAETFERCKTILESHLQGERTKKHPHFLKSTVYCGHCGERMLVQISTSKTGDKYPYFYCAGRHSKRTRCDMKAVLIDEVERKITDYYRHLELDPTFRSRVEAMIRDGFQSAKDDVAQERAHLKLEREKLERQREKLMEAHYAGAIPVDLLGREQERITANLTKIVRKLDTVAIQFQRVESNLTAALDLTIDVAAAYREAPQSVKRLFNQAFFERILLIRDDDAPDGFAITSELKAPFDTLLSSELRATEAEHRAREQDKTPVGQSADGGFVVKSLSLSKAQGFSKTLLVELQGLEPWTSCMPCKRSSQLSYSPSSDMRKTYGFSHRAGKKT